MILRLLRRLLTAAVVLFLLVEAVLWIFVRIPVHPPLRFSLTNDLPGLKRDVRLELLPDLVRTSGWNGGAKTDGVVRILCVGGGATFGMLQNADDTWWGQLRARLEADGIRCEIVARGQENAGILASAVVASSLADRYRPDVIVANFGFDDAATRPSFYRYDPEKIAKLPAPREASGWRRAIVTVSQSARALRWWRVRNQAAAIANTRGRPEAVAATIDELRKRIATLEPREGPVRTEPDDPIREFLDGWNALREVAARHDAALVMTGEASLHDSVIGSSQMERLVALLPIEILDPEKGLVKAVMRPSPAWVEREMNRFAAAAEGFAAEHGIPWIDLNGRIPRTLENFFSDAIFTDAGAAEAARLLAPVVEPVARKAAGS